MYVCVRSESNYLTAGWTLAACVNNFHLSSLWTFLQSPSPSPSCSWYTRIAVFTQCVFIHVRPQDKCDKVTSPHSWELYILEIKCSELIVLHCNSDPHKNSPLETLIEYKLKFNAFSLGVEELVQAHCCKLAGVKTAALCSWPLCWCLS